MAFLTIPTSLIAVGKAVKAELFNTYIKPSLDDLDSRVSLVEGSVNRVIPWNDTVFNATTAATITGGFGFYRATSDFTVTLAQIGVFDISGPTWVGNLEMDIQKSTTPDFSSSVSIFTTKPSINMATASNYDVSSNAVIGASGAISDGDYLRLDISALPSGGVLGSFQVLIEGEA